jgi:hypothetical protein
LRRQRNPPSLAARRRNLRVILRPLHQRCRRIPGKRTQQHNRLPVLLRLDDRRLPRPGQYPLQRPMAQHRDSFRLCGDQCCGCGFPVLAGAGAEEEDFEGEEGVVKPPLSLRVYQSVLLISFFFFFISFFLAGLFFSLQMYKSCRCISPLHLMRLQKAIVDNRRGRKKERHTYMYL